MGFPRELVVVVAALGAAVGVGATATEPATLSQLEYGCSSLWLGTDAAVFDTAETSLFDHVPDNFETLEIHGTHLQPVLVGAANGHV